MQRDLIKLSGKKYQVLVVGGGIYGACVARDAALRGLSVALIEKGDFGNATSANSLKIIHGGLRYLQDMNLKRVRKMAVERSTWLRIAPHLVRPLACMTPTYTRIARSKLVLATAMVFNDMISFDRNRSLDLDRRLPRSRTISRRECLKALDEFELGEITGGAVWYDALISNSERLLLSVLLSASQVGADVVNYVEALGFLGDRQCIKGVLAKNVLTGDEFDIQAEIVVNCAGAWVDNLLDQLEVVRPSRRYIPSKALNIVTRRIKRNYAIGLPGKLRLSTENGDLSRGNQMLFFVPWRGYTLIGTKHFSDSTPVTEASTPDKQIAEFIEEINRTLPRIELSLADILHVHWGFLPMLNRSDSQVDVKLLRESRVHDHLQEEGLEGLITVVGVKYTTARATAQHAVDMGVQKLGVNVSPCRTHEIPVYGGDINHVEDYLARAQIELNQVLDPDVVEHLVYTYGSEYQRIVAYLKEDPGYGNRIAGNCPIIHAEIVHAVREEMSQNLNDVIRRRTELGAAGPPSLASLRSCAEIMGKELGWTSEQREHEVGKVVSSYPFVSDVIHSKD